MIYKLMFCFLLVATQAKAMDDSAVIVGGGLAGLVAAHFSPEPLRVFDARHDFGGRVKTHRAASWGYEEGGTFIDNDHNEMKDLCEGFRLPLDKITFADKITTIFYHQEPVNFKDAQAVVRTAAQSIRDMISEHEKDNSIDIKSSKAYAQLDDMAKAALDTYTLDFYGIGFEQFSISALKHYNLVDKFEAIAVFLGLERTQDNVDKLNKSFFNYTIQGGEDRIIEKLVDSLVKRNVKLYRQHVLKKINKIADSYELYFERKGDMVVVRSKKVLITLPFSVLRDVDIDISVPLTQFQRQAIANLSYGQHIKIGVPLQGQIPLQEKMLLHIDLDNKVTSWPGTNALTIFAGGREWNGQNQEQLRALVLETIMNMQHAYDSTLSFTTFEFHDWNVDPYSKGSYSTMSKESKAYYVVDPMDARRWLFAKSPDNQLYFAGEHTMADDSQAYQEGAVRSAKIVASIW